MRKRIAGVVAVLAVVLAFGAVLSAPAQAAEYRYWAKCQGATYAHPQRHTIYKTYNNVWKFLVPWCPAGYNYAGAIFQVAWVPTYGYWRIPA